MRLRPCTAPSSYPCLSLSPQACRIFVPMSSCKFSSVSRRGLESKILYIVRWCLICCSVAGLVEVLHRTTYKTCHRTIYKAGLVEVLERSYSVTISKGGCTYLLAGVAGFFMLCTNNAGWPGCWLHHCVLRNSLAGSKNVVSMCRIHPVILNNYFPLSSSRTRLCQFQSTETHDVLINICYSLC